MLKIRPVSDELAKIAKEELNEVPKRISDDIASIKEWISKQPHLKPFNDDQLLVSFLRGCKYSLERVKQKLDAYCSFKTTMPELLMNRDPTDPILMKIIRLGIFLVLPSTEKPGGPIVLLFRIGLYEPNEYSDNDFIKVLIMIADLLLRDHDSYPISGLKVIYDLSKCRWAHLLAYNLTNHNKMVSFFEEAMPTRIKAVHLTNPPAGIETFINLIKTVMSEKLKERLFVHGDDMEHLYKHIPQRLLPAEYGGDAGPVQDIIDDWEEKLIANKDYFKETEKFATDESRRLIIKEVIGSFRKLDVD